MPVKNAEEYINKHVQWKSELGKLREIFLSTELTETIKWGAPTYTLNGKNVVGMAAFKNHYALWFYKGSLLKENTDLLINAQEGKTSGLRQIRFKKDESPEAHVLNKYVLEAIKIEKEGKQVPIKKSTVETPPELTTAFQKDQELHSAFEKLSAGKQKDYNLYISEAKREATKKKRLEKIIPMIKNGQGLNDKYK